MAGDRMHHCEGVISRLVDVLNSRGLEPLFEVDVPSELRTAELVEIPDMFAWRIQPSEKNEWVPALEALLPYPLPALYRALISGYRFAEFELGPVMFLANTGKDVYQELSRCIFADKGLYPTLLGDGFIQFGKQAGGGYDPVCFAMKRSKQNDAPIVQIDHEDVLMRNRIRVVAEIAPSFRAFVERVIAGEYQRS
jgi:hypothetical protein